MTGLARCVQCKSLSVRLEGCELRKTALLAVACGLLVGSVLTSAAVAATQESDWVQTLGSRVNWVETISLPKFTGDPATLTGIDILFDTSMDCEIGVENLAAVPSDLSVDLSITTKVSRNGITIASKTYQRAYTYQAVAATDDNLDWAGPSGRKYPQFIYEDTPVQTYSVPGALFGDFVGGGTIDFEVSALRDYWIPTSTAGSMAAYYKADVPGKVKVVYTYVPEPGGIVAMTAGMIGLAGLVTRRRRIS
jgi:hypothetical protein